MEHVQALLLSPSVGHFRHPRLHICTVTSCCFISASVALAHMHMQFRVYIFIVSGPRSSDFILILLNIFLEEKWQESELSY